MRSGWELCCDKYVAKHIQLLVKLTIIPTSEIPIHPNVALINDQGQNPQTNFVVKDRELKLTDRSLDVGKHKSWKKQRTKKNKNPETKKLKLIWGLGIYLVAIVTHKEIPLSRGEKRYEIASSISNAVSHSFLPFNPFFLKSALPGVKRKNSQDYISTWIMDTDALFYLYLIKFFGLSVHVLFFPGNTQYELLGEGIDLGGNVKHARTDL